MNELHDGRILVWFSCGAASTVAAKLAIERYHSTETVEVCYCEVANEHPDNHRYLKDVERWLGISVKMLRSSKYSTDIFDVFEKERYIVGIKGARCTRALKREVRGEYQRPGDVHVFGYTADEEKRIADFEENNRDLNCEWLLYEAGITKKDCYRIVKQAGIELPAMYKLGYKNNNCIGCVKGGAGYWNKIRRDFPEHFDRMAQFSRKLGVRMIKLGGERIFLDELPVGVGRYDEEPDIECGPQCVVQPTLFEL